MEASIDDHLMLVVDNFLPEKDFNEEVFLSDNLEYKSYDFGGVQWPSMRVGLSKTIYPFFEDRLGIKITPMMDYHRKYELNINQPSFIHSDESISEFTAVLSIKDDNGDLAFWKNRKTGAISSVGESFENINMYRHDGLKESAWQITNKIEMKANRCVIYKADLFHSRYPQIWNKSHARLVHVFFFNKKEQS